MADYMKPKFVMTSELEAIRARGMHGEPWIQDTRIGSPPQHLLDSLPATDDVPGMVYFLGLDGTMSTLVLRKYQDQYDAAHPLQPYEVRPRPDDISKQAYHFPIISKLFEIYLERDAGDDSDPDDTYESYIRGGLTQGLRPEYAIFCGLHTSESRWSENYASHFYTKSYQEHADNIARSNLARFNLLWSYKLQSEQNTSPKDIGNEKGDMESLETEPEEGKDNVPTRSEVELPKK